MAGYGRWLKRTATHAIAAMYDMRLRSLVVKISLTLASIIRLPRRTHCRSTWCGYFVQAGRPAPTPLGNDDALRQSINQSINQSVSQFADKLKFSCSHRRINRGKQAQRIRRLADDIDTHIVVMPRTLQVTRKKKERKKEKFC